MVLNSSAQILAQFGFYANPIALADGRQLEVLELVRSIPNKRLVCRAVCNQQTVYAKIFIGKDAQKYAARDQHGVGLLQQAGIATPALINADKLATQSGAVLLFAEVPDCENAEQAYAAMTEKARFNLVKLLVMEVAKHHNAGLLQTDLYLKNFLVKNDKIYTLDGDGIRKFSPLSKQKALENLSVLLSKFDVLALENGLPDLLKTYAQTRSWHKVPDAYWLQHLTQAHRRQVASNYADKKVFRNCTDVKIHALRGLLYAASSLYENILLPTNIAELDAAFTPQTIIKNGNTCTVAITQIGDLKIVIKRYNIKSFWHGVSRALRQTRAAASWANAHRLGLLGIATAKPIALIETRSLGLRGKAYFLAEYIDAPDAAEFFNNTNNKGHRAAAIKNIATLFYKLYLLQISHGDMKATNIKLQNNKPVLIDLDSMRQHSQATPALQAHVRDLRRFMQNWQSDASLYNAFMKAFVTIYKDQTPLKMAQILENISS